jgi:hypothetical protein
VREHLATDPLAQLLSMRFVLDRLALAGFVPCLLAFQLPLQVSDDRRPVAVNSSDTLVQFVWPTRHAADRAHALLLDQGADVWSTRSDSVGESTILFRLRTTSGRNTSLDELVTQLGALRYTRVLDSVQEHIFTSMQQARVDSVVASAAIRPPGSFSLAAARTRTGVPDSIHEAYHPYETINAIMHSLANEYPEYARVVSLGQSAEGRDILALKGQSTCPCCGLFSLTVF